MSDRRIELFRGHDEQWRWRVRGANSSDILSDGGQGYSRRIDAARTARSLHADLKFVDEHGNPIVIDTDNGDDDQHT